MENKPLECSSGSALREVRTREPEGHRGRGPGPQCGRGEQGDGQLGQELPGRRKGQIKAGVGREIEMGTLVPQGHLRVCPWLVCLLAGGYEGQDWIGQWSRQ